MTIPTSAPLAITSVTSSSSHPVYTTTPNHGLSTGAIVAIGGCVDANGALIANLNSSGISITVLGPNTFETAEFFVTEPVFGGGVWPIGGEISHTPLTTLDAQLTLRVANKEGDTIFGQYVLTGSPGVYLLSVPPYEVSPTLLTEVTGSSIEFCPGVEAILGDNDDWQLDSPFARTILISSSETFTPFVNGNLYLSQTPNGPIGIAIPPTISPSAEISDFWIPLSRIHDKSTLRFVTLYFFPNQALVGAGFQPPTITPTLQIFRINPSQDVPPPGPPGPGDDQPIVSSSALTSLTANGPAIFPTPASASSYCKTPSVPSIGYVESSFLSSPYLVNGIIVNNPNLSIPVPAGTLLKDSSGNTFSVLVSTNAEYYPLTPILIKALNPPFGANTNHAPGDILTWITPPPGLSATATVIQTASDGLVGGLSPGYAQTLTYTPDADLAFIDQSTYVYMVHVTDDNVSQSNNASLGTCYTGISLTFENITDLHAQ